MERQRIVVLARFQARKGFEEELKGILRQQAAEAGKDPGCIRFDLLRKEDEQGVLYFDEAWESRADMENHLKMPYLPVYRAKREPFLDGPPEVTICLLAND